MTLPSLITQAPRLGERIVDDDGRASRKFIKFLEEVESIEITNATDQSIQDAIGNLAQIQSYISRINSEIVNLANLSSEIAALDGVLEETSANSGKIGQLFSNISRMALSISDLAQTSQTDNTFLIASIKRDMDRPFAPSKTVAQATADVWKAGSYIYVTNESGGATLAASNGTNWQRCTDLTNIS